MGVVGSGINRLTGRPKLPVFGAPSLVYLAWNPADKSANVALTNNDYTATANSAASGSVRSITSRATGKWHFECTVTVSSGGVPSFGVANATESLANLAGLSANSIGLFPADTNGRVVQNSATVAVGLAMTATGIFAIEIDADARTMYVQQSGGSRFGPYSITVTGALFAIGSVSANTASLTLNTGGSAFAITPTSGFSAWG